MNSYLDQYGRYHTKPVTELNPVPTNNGWIYTAYAQKVGLWVDDYKLRYCFELCKVDSFTLNRSPSDSEPPISRDEILGMAALGVLNPINVGLKYFGPQYHKWSFSPYQIPKFNFIKLVKQLLEAKNKHRNYFWENNLDQMYRFAFSVPLVDRHFILQKFGKFNILYWAIAKVDSFIGKDSGIRFLKYDKSKKAMLPEFPADHPINI